MATGKSVGIKVGRGVGIVGATLWKGTCLVAAATGEFGVGVAEGAEQGWEERCAKMDLAAAQRKLAVEQKALAYAASLAQKSAPMQVAA